MDPVEANAHLGTSATSRQGAKQAGATGGRRPPPANFGEQLATWKHSVLVLVVAIPLLICIVLGALYMLDARQAHANVDATYVDVDLALPSSKSTIDATYLRVRGISVHGWSVTHKINGQQDYELVPVVGAGWTKGSPINYVIKLENGDSLPRRQAATGNNLPAINPHEVRFLARRISGVVPPGALKAFEEDGFKGAERAPLIQLVPDVDGKAVQADLSNKSFVRIGVGMVLIIFCWILAGAVAWKRARAGSVRI